MNVLFHSAKVYFFYVAYMALPYFLLLVLVHFALSSQSALGVALVIFDMLILYFQRQNFWRESYKIIGIVASVDMVLVYGAQFLYFDQRFDPKVLAWFGI